MSVPPLADQPERRDIPALTAVRWPLALWVLAYHLAEPGGWLDPAAWWPPAADLVRCGYVAVGIFFVLSGYILYRVHLGLDRAGWGGFALARLGRLWPVHLLALAVAAPFAWAPSAPELPFWMALVCLVGLQAWVPGHGLALNGPAWSMSVEAFFAAMFPVLLPQVRRLAAPACLVGLLACWALAVLPAWLAAPGVPALAGVPASEGWRADGAASEAVKFLPLLRLPEFVAGMLLAAWHHRRGWSHAGWLDGRWLAGSGLAILVVACAGLADGLPYAPMHNGLLMPAALLVILGLADPRWDATPLAHPVAQILGRSSYALYLLHIPLLMAIHAVARRWAPAMPGPALALVAALVIVVAAVVVHHRFEEPARRRVRRLLGGGR